MTKAILMIAALAISVVRTMLTPTAKTNEMDRLLNKPRKPCSRPPFNGKT